MYGSTDSHTALAKISAMKLKITSFLDACVISVQADQ